MRYAILLLFLLVGCGGPAFSAAVSPELMDDTGESDSGKLLEIDSGSVIPDSGSAFPDSSSVIPDDSSEIDSGSVVSETDSDGIDSGLSADSGSVVDSGAVDSACATPVTHSNGLGQTWTDCVPLGTYNMTQAFMACEAATGAAGAMQCGIHDGDAGGCDNGVFYVGGFWVYAGPTAGHVSSTAFDCPTTASPTWD
jgi:hypothetical protein